MIYEFFPKKVNSTKHLLVISVLLLPAALISSLLFVPEQSCACAIWASHLVTSPCSFVGWDPKLPLRNSIDKFLQNPVLPVSANIRPQIKCIALKLYSSSELMVTKQDTVQIRALNYWAQFSPSTLLSMISLWCLDTSLKSWLNMVTRTSSDLHWESHLESILKGKCCLESLF